MKRELAKGFYETETGIIVEMNGVAITLSWNWLEKAYKKYWECEDIGVPREDLVTDFELYIGFTLECVLDRVQGSLPQWDGKTNISLQK